MKRVIGIVLVIVLALAVTLTGCSSTTPTTAQGDSGNKFAGDSSKEFYMVTFLSGYPFWKDCYRGFEEAGKLYGVTTVYGGATEYDVNAAITALDQIIAKKPAGIAVTCMDAEAYAPSINKAIEQGIPVVTFDSDSPQSNRIAYIGTENYAAGATAARFIGDKLGGKGKVAAVTSLGQSNIKERTDGFQETLAKEYPNIQVVQIVDGGSDQVKAAENVANLLKANQDINYMFCALQTAMIGAQTALNEAGKTDQVKIVGFDTDQTTLDSIKAGTVEASISQSPWCEGFWAMNYLYFINAGLISSTDNWLQKGYPSIPETADSGSMVVTKDNADMFYVTKDAPASASASAAS
jgi:ribose transport system substrate-binding protein